MSTHVRLLVCNDEKTIEELPDYEGPVEKDDTLQWADSKHRTEGGTWHARNLIRVEAKHWHNDKVKQQIISQIREGANHTGLDQDFYDTKNNLQEDAMTCWTVKHNRIPACPDYKTDKMRLQPDTKGLRAEIGVAEFRSTTFLCDYCPVKSFVQTAYYDKHGRRD